MRCRRVCSEYFPWTNTSIIREKNHWDYLKKRAVISKSNSVQDMYKSQRIRVNNLVRNAKRNFCLQNIDLNEHNPKEMWKKINLIAERK